MLPVVTAQGLCRLPEPSPAISFSTWREHALCVRAGTIICLGWATSPPTGTLSIGRWWAMDAAEEQAAFEALMDAIMPRADGGP